MTNPIQRLGRLFRQGESWREFKRLLSFARPYRTRLILAGGCMLFSAAIMLLFPYAIRILVDTAIINKDEALLNRTVLILAAAVLVGGIFKMLSTYLTIYVGEGIVTDIRNRLFHHLQDLSLSFYDENRTGDMMSRISNDAARVQSVLSTNLLQLPQDLMMFLAGLVLIIWTDWRLTLYLVALGPLAGIIVLAFGQFIRGQSRRIQDLFSGCMTILEEVLSCQRIVKAFSREDYENERLTSSLDRYFRGAVRLGWLQSNFIAVMNTILFLALAGLFWYGGQQVLAGRLTPGALISFVLYGVFLVAPVVGLSRQFTQFQNALGASDRIFNLLETQPEVLDHPDAYDLPRIQGRIEINNLSFAYGGNPDRPVLRHINLSIEPGETVAIVGPSGAGKTTLINLIPRFYEIPPGIILIDGHDITAVRQRSLRAKMAIVPQEATLFSGTIADNIRYGDLQADQAAIESAARAANAHQFIEKLEQGYDTRVGERGIKLSGGQRQRIAIARAILRDPRLLILDEATSALDNESEMLVQEALKRLMADRTTLVIAHRLTTIEDADRILVFQDGELHEQGNHQQLMLRNGLYHRLYTRNFEDEDYDQSDPNHISTSESVIHSNTTNS